MGLKINAKNTLSFVGIFLAAITMIVTSVFAILFLSANSRATSLSWTASPDPIISWGTVMQPTGGDNRLGCREEQNLSRVNEGPLSRACVFNGSSVRLIADYMSYVSFGNEEKFYRVYGIGAFNGVTGPTLLSGTDTGYIRDSISYDKSYLAIYKNFASRFIKRTGEPSYNWNSADPDFELRDGTGAYIPIWNAGHSENGKWIVVEALERGIILVNIETEQATLISKYRGYYGLGANPTMQFRVSDDGRHVAIGGWNVEFRVIDVNNCGENAASSTTLTASTMPHPCPERALGSIIRDSTPTGVDKRWISEPRFSSDGTELSVLVGQPDIGLMHVATLTAPGLTLSQRLDYLALGDSYSSGEGDVEINPATNASYYLPGTDNGAQNGLPAERCHISSRSYPFLLRNDFNIPLNLMKSVACSGAETIDIGLDQDNYFGQKNRLIGLSVAEIGFKKAEALDAYIPGRIKQIEFVKKMKPKAITVTIGGNDVQFGPIIKQCASPSIQSCSYAQSGVERGMLGRSIRGQFGVIAKQINALKAASPDTKIYILSYPKFIYAGTAICGFNVGILDSDERALIDNSVEYLNQVISAAAAATGAKFIDIEDALEGGQMCQSNPEYVTGLDAVGWFNSAGYGWAFHPNAEGHEKITNTIKQQIGIENSFLTYPYVQQQNSNISAPTPTSYFSAAMANYDKNAQTVHLANDAIVTAGQPISISVEEYKFKAGSTAHATVRSNPVDLGDLAVNSNGSLSGQVTPPNTLPAGYHTLIISGETYSGEPIDYYQLVLVKGDNLSDVDDNGIDDSQQPCGPFIISSSQDNDFDGLDDACDPEITTPVLYITRNGNSENGEDPTRLYLYRNTRASSITGVTNDYVDISSNPSNKEALVGTSVSSQASFNKFVMLEDGNSLSIPIPTIFARDHNGECIAFQPQDYLSPALSPTDVNYQSRELTRLTQIPQGEECE